MFSRKRHWISWTRFRLDPTRPDLDLGAQLSYRIPRPDPLRPNPIAILESKTRRVGRFSYRALLVTVSTGSTGRYRTVGIPTQ